LLSVVKAYSPTQHPCNAGFDTSQKRAFELLNYHIRKKTENIDSWMFHKSFHGNYHTTLANQYDNNNLTRFLFFNKRTNKMILTDADTTGCQCTAVTKDGILVQGDVAKVTELFNLVSCRYQPTSEKF
jgi:hypothetical protein